MAEASASRVEGNASRSTSRPKPWPRRRSARRRRPSGTDAARGREGNRPADSSYRRSRRARRARRRTEARRGSLAGWRRPSGRPEPNAPASSAPVGARSRMPASRNSAGRRAGSRRRRSCDQRWKRTKRDDRRAVRRPRRPRPGRRERTVTMADTVRLAIPRLEVTMDDGSTFDVQALNPDLLRYDRTAAKHGWPSPTDAPFLWLTFLAWSAGRRTGDVADDHDMGNVFERPLSPGPESVRPAERRTAKVDDARRRRSLSRRKSRQDDRRNRAGVPDRAARLVRRRRRDAGDRAGRPTNAMYAKD